MVKSFLKRNRTDLLILSIFLITLPLFFYKLGQSSLVSWDEAWYADIARNLLKGGNIFHLYWNNSPYTDHPPFGFWVMALTFKLFGINELTARLPSALMGWGSLAVLYLLGKELFNRWVGFLSAIGLTSAVWFMYRSRAGDLDVPLAFLFLLTFYMALKARINKHFLIPLSLSLAALVLTKTIVPLTIFPSLIIIFWKNKQSKKDFIIPVIIFALIIGIWIFEENTYIPNFVTRYFDIGLPGVKVHTDYLVNFRVFKEFLHAGIGKWFWPGIIGMVGGLFLMQRRFLVLSVFFLMFAVPFIFSSNGQIWHLIPLYPFMILSSIGLGWVVSEKIIRLLKLNYFTQALPWLFLIIILYLTLPQVRANWYQFVDLPKYTSDEQILSQEVSKYDLPFFIDENYYPAATFYSGKHVEKINPDDLGKILNDDSKEYLLIVSQWRYNSVKITSTQNHIIKKDRDKILILHGNL